MSSDGKLEDMVFPRWKGNGPKRATLRKLFAYLSSQLPNDAISADLFGLVTVNKDDLGIGQVLEDAVPFFDFVCPMVYPSHFAPGFLGKENPAEYPFLVVYYSMSMARTRLEGSGSGKPRWAKLRPWLQDFSLGAVYDAPMVEDQIKAAEDALGPDYCGYLLWNPSNRYTSAALAPIS